MIFLILVKLYLIQVNCPSFADLVAGELLPPVGGPEEEGAQAPGPVRHDKSAFVFPRLIVDPGVLILSAAGLRYQQKTKKNKNPRFLTAFLD